MGYLYIFGTNERYAITITDWHRKHVMQAVNAIRRTTVDRVPDFAQERNKCNKCSTVQYCMLEETELLEGTKR